MIVIGLDGMGWELLDLYMNELPNLKRLVEEGYSCPLESVFPTTTGPAWVSFQTGNTVGNHGFTYFGEYDEELSLRIYDSRDLRQRTLYEALESGGIRCFLFNLPYTYPPKIGGDVIFSWVDKAPFPFSPSDLAQRFPQLEDVAGYVTATPAGSDREWLEKIMTGLRYEARLLPEITKRKQHDFYFFLITAPDRLYHRIFGRLVDDRQGDKVCELGVQILKQIDGLIGSIWRSLDENSFLVIMSDHGFKRYERTFHLNAWLEKEGYLKSSFRSKAIEDAAEIAESKSRRLPVGSIIRILRKLLPEPWVNRLALLAKPVIARIMGTTPLPGLRIDVNKSTAYSTPMSQMIRLNPRVVPAGQERERIKREIMEKLNSIPGISAEAKENIFQGECLSKIDDIAVMSERHFVSSYHFGSIWSTITTQSHGREGILIINGPGIKRGKGNKANIIDVAPTILHLMDIPLPGAMDGRVIKEIFSQGSPFLDKEVKYQTIDEESMIRNKIKRLRHLGKT
jgi:predicted AlkP superfamily phosphohydrolase/phosphomutase